MTRHPEGAHATRRRALVIFARAPQAGLVKTRLAATVGAAEALRVYRELGSIAIGLSVSDAWETVVAFTPDEAEGETRAWLGDEVRYVAQGAGDLGERMARVIRGRLGTGAARVVVIGTDCPEITTTDIEKAFAALERADIVLGPATDGGYYLIGASADHPELFSDMRWSAPDTLAVTLTRATAAGVTVELLDPRSDIDTAADLEAWRRRRETDAGSRA